MYTTMFKLTILFILFIDVRCWDQDQLDVFDVVEEVNQNFYQLMNIPQVSRTNHSSILLTKQKSRI